MAWQRSHRLRQIKFDGIFGMLSDKILGVTG
jgi:hypothetical protein